MVQEKKDFEKLHSDLNKEKIDILKEKGSALVIANPGTGKTKLLAHKFIDLINEGHSPEDILCLTFTRKAKAEMEERIVKLLQENNFEIDFSKLNIYTFHSYAMDYLDDEDIVSSDLLRFNIFEYVLEKEVFTYNEDYLISDIIPKIENSLRYVKNYGILPNNINIEKVESNLEDLKKGKITKYTKEELVNYLKHFNNIFKQYEKNKKGLDYTDVLINFLNIKNFDKFKFVLIDELQDVNNLEAQIALKSGEKFFAVGDKKQAIFGFQGGSITNFEHFKSISKEFKLVENFRSTNQILDYAKEFYTKKDKSAKEELEGLVNAKNEEGKKPVIIEAEKLDKEKLVNLTKKLASDLKEKEKLGIIVRTNGQILKYSKVLEQSGVNFSATYSASSEEARKNIIKFIYAIFSDNIEIVKNSFFTPFFPLELEKSFKLSGTYNLTLENIYEVCPKFKEMRKSVKNIEDINNLFNNYILPVCFAYGQDYVLAATTLKNASVEALNELNNISLEKYINYLKASDILGGENINEASIVLTTIHKSKGLQYDKVIFIPSKSRDQTSFSDAVASTILKTNLDDYADSELSEDDLRNDFVAITRAKKELYIITKKAVDYVNSNSTLEDVESEVNLEEKLVEKQRLAFNLFVNGEYDKAKELLKTNKEWLKEYIVKHFLNLEKLSFSAVQNTPYEYLTRRILKLNAFGSAINTGLTVHKKIEETIKGNKVEVTEEEKPFFENAMNIIDDLKRDGYEFVKAEYKIDMPIKKLLNIDSKINYIGYIDAVYKKGDNYLLVDWKTNRTNSDLTKHKQQLSIYKKAFSILENVHEEKIDVAVSYIGLRKNINDGLISSEYNNRKPASSAIETISKKLSQIVDWGNNPDLFIEELKNSEEDDVLIRAIKEELN